jgi:hypothetical protein
MKLRGSLLSFCLVAALGCGGKSRPAATPEPEPAAGGDEASCCCDYIKEEGDPAGDTWSENQTYELMTPAGCADLSGTCGDDTACTVPGESDEESVGD